MSYIENEVAYENAIQRNIIANAQKTFHRTYEDANKNVVVYIGNNYYGEKDEVLSFKASVKEHRVFNGSKQTVVSRITVI